MQIQIHLSAFVFWIIVTILVLAFILSIFLRFDEWIPFAFLGGLIVATALRPSLVCDSKNCKKCKNCKHGDNGKCDHDDHGKHSDHEDCDHEDHSNSPRKRSKYHRKHGRDHQDKGYGEHSKHREASDNCENDDKFKLVYNGLIFVTLFAIFVHIGIRMGKDFCVEPCRNNICCGDKRFGSIF